MKIASRFLIFLFLIWGITSCNLSQPQRPTVMVIFGATGDLTNKKILPAIQGLAGEGRLPEKFAVVGFARRFDPDFEKQGPHYYYNQASFDTDEGYEQLEALLRQIDKAFGKKSNRIYFLATQPSHFQAIIEKLSSHHLISRKGTSPWTRVMIEKPLGHDYESALSLEKTISHYLDEKQVYRIDHFLGKEGVQNLIHFRMKPEGSAIWNRDFIDHIEISLSEEIGIGTRANFWEETGFLRDVVQNHMMQLLSLVAMEPGPDLPQQKLQVLQSIRPIDPQSVLRAQYEAGIIAGAKVLGYKEEPNVSADSHAETYVAAELSIDNERWRGVPFLLRGGKRLSKQETEIIAYFKSGDKLHIRIQPDPAVFFEKGEPLSFKPFCFKEAYQKLIYDCIQGDQSAFVQKEEHLAAWKLLTPLLDSWETQSTMLTYPAGTSGPSPHKFVN